MLVAAFAPALSLTLARACLLARSPDSLSDNDEVAPPVTFPLNLFSLPLPPTPPDTPRSPDSLSDDDEVAPLATINETMFNDGLGLAGAWPRLQRLHTTAPSRRMHDTTLAIQYVRNPTALTHCPS